MSDYRVGDGHDIALASLTVLDPQPHTEGLQVVTRSYGLDDSVHEEGNYIEFLYSSIETPAQYQSILTDFGLDAALTNQVTIYVPDFDYSYARFNGLAVRPEPGQDIRRTNFFLRQAVILVKGLEYSS